jgi:large subunit ribosomal protein L4
MEPVHFEQFSSKHLHLPLRRDILHRAVIYEGDATRSGTASTKWRSEIHGSNRKIRPQKGSGMARLGNKKSPMLRGGGVAFGPKPRDFGTDLPRKIYDIAWRTALSYRYRRGQLIIIEDGKDLECSAPSYVKEVFEHNHWGKADGRSTIVTSEYRENLFEALDGAGGEGRVLKEDEVDVKDLLETGRIIIEKRALQSILQNHQSDLVKSTLTASM